MGLLMVLVLGEVCPVTADEGAFSYSQGKIWAVFGLWPSVEKADLLVSGLFRLYSEYLDIW
jgi:hypothetical protein